MGTGESLHSTRGEQLSHIAVLCFSWYDRACPMVTLSPCSSVCSGRDTHGNGIKSQSACLAQGAEALRGCPAEPGVSRWDRSVPARITSVSSSPRGSHPVHPAFALPSSKGRGTHQKTETGHFDSQPSLGQRTLISPRSPVSAQSADTFQNRSQDCLVSAALG